MVETVEEYIQSLQYWKKKSESTEKFERNARLINKLDKFYGLKTAYPWSEDPNLIEFWSDKDPSQFTSFRHLLRMNKKSWKVQHCGPNDFFVEIHDK